MKAIINQQPVQKALGYSTAKYPKQTVFKPIPSIRQYLDSSCGPAVVTSILQAMGHSITERKVIKLAVKELNSKNMTLEKDGVPPDVIKDLLKKSRVKYTENRPDSGYKNIADKIKAQKKLDKMLKDGYVCITPVQVTPEYWCIEKESRKVLRKTYNATNCKDSSVELVKVLFSEEKLPPTKNKAIIENKDGHYMIVAGMVKDDKEEYYITMDPAIAYWRDSYKDGTPRKYRGMRIISKKLFVEHWHDISTSKKTYYHYLIAVKPRFASK